MAHLLQVGAGSGGMPVLDMLARDPQIKRVTLIEPDVYKPHNVERHLFPLSEVGNPKAEAAQRWANHVSAEASVGVRWRYLLVAESDVAGAKGDWQALKALNRI